jgi:signal transduction histidine kinase
MAARFDRVTPGIALETHLSDFSWQAPPAKPARTRVQGLFPQSLLGRMGLVLLVGMLLTQSLAYWVWSSQVRARAGEATLTSAQHMARSAANTIRFFRSVPHGFRPLVISQFRDMGGTRFFASVSSAPVQVQGIAGERLADLVVDTVRDALRTDMPYLNDIRTAMAWPDRLLVSEGVQMGDLPDSWVQHILVTQPEQAPVLVIQAEMEPGQWLYLASLMPNPHFLDADKVLAADRVLLQAVLLLAALAMLVAMVRVWITQPLAELSKAALAFGRGEPAPRLPARGCREFVHTAKAFDDMRELIEKYLEDRERLFVSISHDLRTPITRLKLRAEMLDDDTLRQEFEEDLDELDVMVKGALQCVKDSDIHEDVVDMRLDVVLDRLVRGARLSGKRVGYQPCGLVVRGKPLAFKRAITNLLDNALHYGDRADVSARSEGAEVVIEVHDDGPGVPPAALSAVFEPRMRLSHGRLRNQGGLGLGLGIARSMIVGQGGDLQLCNHPGGGLVASVRLPAAAAPSPEAETVDDER